MSFKSKYLLVLALVVAITTLIFSMAIPVGAQSDDSGQQDLKVMIAEVYSKHYGVSMTEALHRLDLQDSFPELEPQLESNQAETFGGLWIQHEPEYKIVVAFTHDGDRAITKYSKYIPAKIAPYIEVRTVTKSLLELLDDQAKLKDSLHRQGLQADSGVDVINNCVSIDITKNDEAKFNSAKQDGKLEIPDRLKINLVDGLVELTTDIYGGLTLQYPNGYDYNTAGFSVTTEGGTKGIVTCGHAEDTLYYSSISLPMQGDDLFSGSFDCQWHTCPGLTVTNEMKFHPDGSTIEIDAIIPRSSQAIGSTIGKYGRVTGFTCGELLSKTWEPEAVPYASPTWMLVYNEYGYDKLVEVGDSGCPWFTEGDACGIQSCTSEDRDYACYMAVDYLSYLGVSVLTD